MISKSPFSNSPNPASENQSFAIWFVQTCRELIKNSNQKITIDFLLKHNFPEKWFMFSKNLDYVDFSKKYPNGLSLQQSHFFEHLNSCLCYYKNINLDNKDQLSNFQPTDFGDKNIEFNALASLLSSSSKKLNNSLISFLQKNKITNFFDNDQADQLSLNFKSLNDFIKTNVKAQKTTLDFYGLFYAWLNNSNGNSFSTNYQIAYKTDISNRKKYLNDKLHIFFALMDDFKKLGINFIKNKNNFYEIDLQDFIVLGKKSESFLSIKNQNFYTALKQETLSKQQNNFFTNVYKPENLNQAFEEIINKYKQLVAKTNKDEIEQNYLYQIDYYLKNKKGNWDTSSEKAIQYLLIYQLAKQYPSYASCFGQVGLQNSTIEGFNNMIELITKGIDLKEFNQKVILPKLNNKYNNYDKETIAKCWIQKDNIYLLNNSKYNLDGTVKYTARGGIPDFVKIVPSKDGLIICLPESFFLSKSGKKTTKDHEIMAQTMEHIFSCLPKNIKQKDIVGILINFVSNFTTKEESNDLILSAQKVLKGVLELPYNVITTNIWDVCPKQIKDLENQIKEKGIDMLLLSSLQDKNEKETMAKELGYSSYADYLASKKNKNNKQR